MGHGVATILLERKKSQPLVPELPLNNKAGNNKAGHFIIWIQEIRAYRPAWLAGDAVP